MKRGIIRYKTRFIAIFILWIVLSLIFISPLSISIHDAMETGQFSLEIFILTLRSIALNPMSAITLAFSTQYILSFWSLFWKWTLFYFLVIIFGIMRSIPRSEYGDIEHGSGDWAVGGEQYKVLSRKKGILLAENQYLPVDKRGNVNVLVVGRFWFW